MTRLLVLNNVWAKQLSFIHAGFLSLGKYHMLYSRFDDDCESVSPLSVEEPVNQVS